ncbi:uncharacterized protein LOC121202759 isoform X2 [Betta splendens]|uniref:Uncharacterized protein LOC121202759 isoform X2 n=1 Tax=Betta splendens TaxID=158456 RepID=A0A9W2XAQ7_BETSP|nr:uncharacterized protein LOC121202759 isoform X2 [Betta splendens]
MTNIWNDTSREMRRLDVSEWETLIGAVCKDRHWTLIVIYPRQGKALYIDPFGATSGQLMQCRDKTRAFLRRKNINISRWKCETISHPRQQDSTSCGVFVCKIAEQLLLGQQVVFQTEKAAIDLIRLEMAQKLIDESDDLMDLCHACGDRDTSEALVDDWIECTTCQRWFHWVCVGKPNTEAVFLCPACQ